jgi:hypothetical protein
MKKFCILFSLLSTGLFTSAQIVNFSEHIAPIIYNHCTSCHRPGEVAPFPLTNYSEVQSWATMIKYVTDIKYMPPFKADPAYQEYQKVNTLSASEIQLISDWVDAGTPQGNTTLEPPLPVFPTGSAIGTPDLTLSFSQKHLIDGNNTDEYRYFVLPTGLTQDKDLVALEMRPGNTSMVHHALAWVDTTGTSAAEDASTPEYGYAGGTQQVLSDGNLDKQLPTYVPGQKPTVLSNGLAYKMPAGSDLLVQIHYAPSPVATSDSTTYNLFFAPTPAQRYIKSHVMVPFLGTIVNNFGLFVIPANQTREFHGVYTMPENASMISTMPHMHMLGTHWLVYAIKPNGDTVNLVKIDDWDFNWQSNYDFKRPIHLPQGTQIHAFAGYDNTTNNVNNPNNPPQTITWGENTNEEMYWLPLQWVSYQTGDELIDLEPTGIDDERFFSVKDKLYPVYPNPANESLTIGFTLGNQTPVSLKLYNINGDLVEILADNKLHNSGLHSKELNVSHLPSGVYALILETKGKREMQRVVVTR